MATKITKKTATKIAALVNGMHVYRDMVASQSRKIPYDFEAVNQRMEWYNTDAEELIEILGGNQEIGDRIHLFDIEKF